MHYLEFIKRFIKVLLFLGNLTGFKVFLILFPHITFAVESVAFYPLSSSNLNKQDDLNDDWSVRIEAEAHEHIRSMKDHADQAIEALKKCRFDDLIDPLSVAKELLSDPLLIKKEILRRCVYSLIRKNIFSVRSASIEGLISEIQKKIKDSNDLTSIAELEICQALLSLITPGPQTLEKLIKTLHPDVTKKHPERMVSLILQAYKKSEIYFTKLWFPTAIRLEELFLNVGEEQKNLLTLKKYIYGNCHADWRIMSLAFRRMLDIIQGDYLEDIRDSAYWVGMEGGNSIKIVQFTDPTPYLSPKGYYAPLLEQQARYEAAKFLIQLSLHADDDIANHAKQSLSDYAIREKDPQIRSLYLSSLLLQASPPNPPLLNLQESLPKKGAHPPLHQERPKLTKESPQDNDRLHLFAEAYFWLKGPLPLETAKKMALYFGFEGDISPYIILSDSTPCQICTFIKNPEGQRCMKREDTLLFKKRIINFLSEEIKFQPKKIKTWRQTFMVIENIEGLIGNIAEYHDFSIIKTIYKLREFYAVTKKNPKHLKLYQKICTEYEILEKSKRLLTWKKAGSTDSLDIADYGEYFTNWKEAHNLNQINVEDYSCTPDGTTTMLFSIVPYSGNKTLIRAWRLKKKIGFSIIEGFTMPHNKDWQTTELAFMKLCEDMDTVFYRGYFDISNASSVINFFESLMMNNHYSLETITLSTILFTMQFGFLNNHRQWGLPEMEELTQIINMKLCLSYLFCVYGKEQAQSTYLKYNTTALRRGRLVLLPRPLVLPETEKERDVMIPFYNTVLKTPQQERILKILETYDHIIKNLDHFDNARSILYVCTLALQKVLIRNPETVSFSIKKAVNYIQTLQRTLLKHEMIELKALIYIIFKNASFNTGSIESKEGLNFINAFNVCMPIFYPCLKISEEDTEIVNHLTARILKICSFILEKFPLNHKTIETFSKFHAFYTFTQGPCVHLERKMSHFLNPSLNVTEPSYATALIKGGVDFFLLNNKHPSFYVRQLEVMLNAVVKDEKRIVYFAQMIFPVSTILWSSALRKPLIYFSTSLLNHLELHYNTPSLKQIVRHLNLIINIRKNLNLVSDQTLVRPLKERVDRFYKKMVKDLINGYILPLWKDNATATHHNKIKSICAALMLPVKEDQYFLSTMEEAYQDYISQRNPTESPISLEHIIEKINKRFNHKAFSTRLKRKDIPTYKKDGTLAEYRKDFDVLSFILGQNSYMSYLKLEDNKSDFLEPLIAPIMINGEERVTGFGGGGKMKMRVNVHGLPETTVLPLLPLKDIIGGMTGALLQAISSKEAFYYWQRMFNPALASGDIVAGAFTILYRDDETVCFGPVTNADGCGFIRAGSLGDFNERLSANNIYSARTPIQTYQALHHCKKKTDPSLFDECVKECSHLSLNAVEEYLSSNQSNQASVKELYSTMTTSGIHQGRNFVAIAAHGKGHIVVPMSLKNADIILGKTPYEKPSNIGLRRSQEISHLKSEREEEKEKAQKLSQLYGFQYSFLGSTGSSLSFAKGILIVIPEELWTYPEIDIIMCPKDKKIDSSWKDKKDPPPSGTVERSNGVLTALQNYGPGSFIAVSSDIQVDQWNGDYDGDIIVLETVPKDFKKFSLLLKSSYLSLYNTPKIPKTFTNPTLPNGEFGIFRFSSIVQARTGNLLMVFTKAYDIFIALKEEHQHNIASILAKTRIISKILLDPLDKDEKDNVDDLIFMVKKVLSAGVKMGADSFKLNVDWTYYREFIQILNKIYDLIGIPTEIIYFKKFCIDMHNKSVNFQDTLLNARYQSRYFDSLPLYITLHVLSEFPQHKQKRLSQLLKQQMEQDPRLNGVQEKTTSRQDRKKSKYLK
jgi:hypothetical protein